MVLKPKGLRWIYVCYFFLLFIVCFYRGNSGVGRGEGKVFEMQAMCGFNCAKMVDSKVVLSCLSPTVYKALRYITRVQWSSVVQTIRRPLVDRLYFLHTSCFLTLAVDRRFVTRKSTGICLFMNLLRCCGDLNTRI